jgi:hypothetical protein
MRTRQRPLPFARITLLAVLGAAATACYEPDFGDGDFACGPDPDHECPPGNVCGDDGKCHAAGAHDGAPGSDTGGGSDAAIDGPIADAGGDAASVDADLSPDGAPDAMGDVVPPETLLESGPPALTNQTTATFTFSADEPDASFSCQLDGAAFAPCASPHTLTVGGGTHAFAVYATDAAGNPDATPATQSWTVDIAPPDTTIDSGPSGVVTVGSATFTFSASEPGTFSCSHNGAAFTACASPHALAGLGDGSHTFEVRAHDDAGNIDPSPASRSFTVDTGGPPDTSITSAPPTLANTNSASFSFAATESGSTFACQLDGASFATCFSPASFTGLAEDSHTFAVRATDTTGMTDPSPASHTWSIDTAAPNTTITSGPSGTLSTTSVTFTFTSTESGTFECRLGGAAYAACASPHTITGLTNGSYTFDVRAIDAASNVDPSPANASWTIDTTGPPQTTITASPPGATNSAIASFSFISSKSGSTFECNKDAVGFSSCASPISYTGVVDGAHTFQVRATDMGGMVDPTPAAASWFVDTKPPETTIDSGPSGTITDTTPTLAFSADESATFECSVDAAAYAPCTSPLTLGPLVDGPHSLAVRAKDDVGNVDASPAMRSWAQDAKAPETTIDSGPSGSTTATSATFAFSADEALSTFACSLDGAATTSCTSPTSYSGLGLGSHTFEVKATDPAGNPDPSPASRTWSIISGDTMPPDTSIDSGPSGTVATTSATFAFSCTEAGCTFSCSLNGAAYETCASPKSYTVPANASSTFAVYATDAAGNADSTPASRTWTVDTMAPDTSIDSGPSGAVASTDATFTFSCTDATCTYSCRIDGGSYAACTSPKSYSGLAQDSHTFDVYATDSVGNPDATPASRTWTADTMAPETTATGPSLTPSTSVKITFTSSESGSTFICKLDSGLSASCTSPKTYTSLSVTSHTVSVVAIDAAGNADLTPATVTFTVVQPMFHYTFDANANNTGYVSGYHGTAMGVTYPAGKFGNAVRFAASATSFVKLPGTKTPLSVYADYTIGVWFREDSVLNKGYLIDFRNPIDPGGGFHSYHGFAGSNLYTCYSANGAPGNCANFAYTTGTWHHLMYRYDGTTTSPGGGAPLQIYLDGNLVTTVANSTLGVIFSTLQANDTTLGKETNFYLDDLKYYNATFSAEDACVGIVGGTWSGSSCAPP